MADAALRVVDVVGSAGLGAFFFDDQAAIKAGAVRDGYSYVGTPVTPGYEAVRVPAESTSVMLVLDDGYVATGDCASVQYSGVGGREPLLHAATLAARFEDELAGPLQGLPVGGFREASKHALDLLHDAGLGRAAAYGLTQALLDAAAHAQGHHVMGRVIKDEWQLPGPLKEVPLYAQTGEDRHLAVDKMILKRVPILPHGLINTAELVGPDGEALVDYIGFIRGRLRQLRTDDDYTPILHLDVYGMVGRSVGDSVAETATILGRLQDAAGPLQLRVEHPVDGGSRDAQVEAMTELRRRLAQTGSRVQIVADEWANTLEDIATFAEAGAADLIQIKTPDLGSLVDVVEAVLLCKQSGVGPVIGGTCAETDRSARATTHLGIATDVEQMLAKPGMGVDEGLMIVTNEMRRAVRLDARLLAQREHDSTAVDSSLPTGGISRA